MQAIIVFIRGMSVKEKNDHALNTNFHHYSTPYYTRGGAIYCPALLSYSWSFVELMDLILYNCYRFVIIIVEYRIRLSFSCESDCPVEHSLQHPVLTL